MSTEYQKKHDSGTPVWMEELETMVDDQRISGMMFHLGGSVIWVVIQSPFSGFTEADSMNITSRRFYPDGFNSMEGRKRGKALLRHLYIEHKDYAAIVKEKEETEKEERLRTMMSSEDIS
jgi:hypothetical protein